MRSKLEAAGKWQAFRELRDRSQAAGEKQTKDLHERLFYLVMGGAKPSPSEDGSTFARVKDIDLSSIRKRRAGASAIFVWVVRYIDDLSITPSDCPDPMAWKLLSLCRDNPKFEADFIHDGFLKLLAAAPMDSSEDDSEDFDGKQQYDLLSKLEDATDE